MSLPRPMPAAALLPDLAWTALPQGEVRTRAAGWQLLVIYRGRHCSMCRRYLIELNGLRENFARLNVGVAALSADSRAQAASWVESLGLQFPLGFGLAPPQMQALGLYISPAEGEAARAFAEPAVFVTRDDGMLHFACVGNAPYGRPPLAAVLDGVREAIEEDLQPHGTWRA